nr:hypothetical protein [Planomonospora parontospora]
MDGEDGAAALARCAAVIAPPCASTITLVVARPRPVPGLPASRAVEARKNRENSCSYCSAGMPIPVSATTSATPPLVVSPCWQFGAAVTLPLSGMY